MDGIFLLISWQALLAFILGMFFGIITGAIPGFSTPLAISVMLPVTFGLEPIVGMVFLTAIYAGGNFGSSISAVLLNIPGSPQAIVTTLDGYPMTKAGNSNQALGTALASSAMGNLIGTFFLILILPIIVVFALSFGAPELFMVALLGLAVIASLHHDFVKAAIAGLFGILLGTVGMSSTGAVRGTFGYSELLDGIPIIAALVGLIGFSELFSMIQTKYIAKKNENNKGSWNSLIEGFKNAFKHPVNLIRSSIIGVLIGALPGAGGTIASVVSYNESKRYSKNPEKFGKGSTEGLSAAESANNASEGGALALVLSLGIPGGLATAVLIGALLLQGLVPGPRLFMENPELVYGIMFAQFFTSVLLLFGGLLVCYYASKIINVHTNVLIPLIVMFSVVGAFSVSRSVFDIKLMLIFAIIGVFLKKYDFPIIGVVLGIILGSLLDSQLIRTYQTYGDVSVIFTRPISLMLFILFVLSILSVFIRRIRRRKTKK